MGVLPKSTAFYAGQMELGESSEWLGLSLMQKLACCIEELTEADSLALRAATTPLIVQPVNVERYDMERRAKKTSG